jgi:CRP/FNR family cyclic AMP-dependent transcriptional regulator
MALVHRFIGTVRGMLVRLFRPQEDARVRDVVEVLKQVALFRGFPNSYLLTLAETMHQRDYKPDEVLFYERDPGLGFYIVQRGRVRLLAEDDDGSAHELGQVGERQVFGEQALLGDFRRLVTAQAITETRVLGFFQPDFKMVAKRNPAAGIAVMSALARQLAGQQEQLMHHVAAGEGRVAGLRMLIQDAQPGEPVRLETLPG